MKNRSRGRRLRPVFCTEPCEERVLLAVTAFEINQSESTRDHTAFEWSDSDNASDHYELWIDQIAGSHRNSKIAHSTSIPRDGVRTSFQLPQTFDDGLYEFWVRGHGANGATPWSAFVSEIGGDQNPDTRPAINAPTQATFSFRRRGQGALGQEISEAGIGWTGDAALYDVWLGKKNEAGRTDQHIVIRNVPRNVVTLRELASTWESTGQVRYTNLKLKHTQLPTGDYELYVRGVNGATDNNGRWTGRGPWSAGYSFAFHQVEGENAKPANLYASDSHPLQITWSAVPHAESYLVNIWEGPDYSEHKPANVRTHGNSINLNDYAFLKSVNLHETDWSELYVRVRAIGEEGMLEGLQAGNFASLVVKSVQTPETRTKITGPLETSAGQPTLTWTPTSPAATYEVWLTSIDLKQQVFHDRAHPYSTLTLGPDVIRNNVASIYQTVDDRGEPKLLNGRYRLWVRPTDRFGIQGRWSRAHEFTVDSSIEQTLTLPDGDILSPNRILTLPSAEGNELLVANGLGESFGASILTRYRINEDNMPFRELAADDPNVQFRFPAISVGSNVTDMAFWSDSHVLVLSRSSGDIHAVDLTDWQISDSHSFSTDVSAPEPMSLEVLSNGEILVVFHRTAQLHRLNFDGETFRGFPADQDDGGAFATLNRTMTQISAVDLGDRYRLFLSSGNGAGTFIQDYYPTEGRLVDATSIVSRHPSANPYVAATIINIDDGESSFPYFIGSDRNGFLTWINAQTLEHGFEDLALHLDLVSRDISHPDFADPADNGIDPTDIALIGANRIAVINNRQLSAVLKVTRVNEQLVFDHELTLPAGYGASAWTDSAGSFLAVTGPSGNALSIVHLNSDDENTRTFRTSESFVNVVGIRPKQILAESSSAQRMIIASQPDGLTSTSLPATFDVFGQRYRGTNGLSAAYFDSETEETFVIFTVTEDREFPKRDQHYRMFLLVARLETDSGELTASSILNLSHIQDPRTIQVDATRIMITDRLGAAVHWFDHWRSPDDTEQGSYSYSDLPAGYGRTRSGNTRMMPDGTIVTLHDTTPDRVFSVIQSGDLKTRQPFLTIHAHNHGLWINDFEVYDQDRIVAVTWEARVLILNVRTGVIEHNQSLQDLTGAGNIYGVEGISFEEGRLQVTSPGANSITEFQLSPTPHGYSTKLISHQPNLNVSVTSSRVGPNWVLEPNNLRRRSAV